MKKNIISLIILLLCTNTLRAQAPNDSLLLSIEKKLYTQPNDTLKAELILQKANVYFNNGVVNDALMQELQRLDWWLIKDSTTLSTYFWNGALANALHKNYVYADNFLNKYKAYNPKDTALNVLLLSALININLDNDKLLNDIKNNPKYDTLLSVFLCYQSTLQYTKKHKQAYLVASGIVPGAGMVALRKPVKGFNSLVLNTASAFAVYSLLQSNLYFNAAALGITLIQKFYLGGLRLTERTFNERETAARYVIASQCQINIKQLLVKYPINFKKDTMH
ncbi:MAG: hypothetical protein ABL940_12685 [Bacteroidia bacterium]